MRVFIIVLTVLISSLSVKAQFGARQVISGSNNGAYTFCTEDFDNDGDIDMISGSFLDGKINFHENLGGGVFAPQQLINGGTDNIVSVAAGDFDNDGDYDIVFASDTGFFWMIRWHENLGGATFGSQQFLTDDVIWGKRVITADINNDGNTDIVFGSAGDDKVAWFENLGGAVFTAQQHINNPDLDGSIVNGVEGDADHVESILVFDLDNDNDLDVLSISAGDSLIAWYENLGAGTFGPQQIIDKVGQSWGHTGSIHAADMDNDGDEDLITATVYNILFYENLGNSTFGIPQILDSSLYARVVCAVDVDGDGLRDIVAGCDYSHGPQIHWIKNLGNNAFDTSQVVFTLGSQTGMRQISSEDLDGDLDEDLMFASFIEQSFSWIPNFYPNPKLSGTIFFDANQNAQLDTNELGMTFIQSHLTPNNIYSYSTANGEFEYIVDTGTYTLSYTPINHWGLSTDSTSYTLSLSNPSQIIDSLDFGFYPDTILTIVQPDLTGGFPRCNNIINHWISIQNQGTTTPTGIIELELDDSINYVSSAIPPDSIVNQSIYWHYDSLFYWSFNQNVVQVQMPSFTSMGDTLVSILTVHELDMGNNIVYSNTDTLEQILVCAYDPNVKSVSPKGIGPNGYIENDEELEYLIQFQNTGTDTAITVIIRDQLDFDLDWSTLQPIANSHPMQLWVEQGGEVVFKFENILLPDSGSDFLGSQGFVKFKIDLKSGLAYNTPIFNTAHIYFDNNTPVITNTVLNTIDSTGVITEISKRIYSETNEMVVFPNPFGNRITVYLKGKVEKEYSISLYNVMGKEIFRSVRLTKNKTTLYLDDLSSGTYIIVGKDTSGNILFREQLICK